MTSKKDSVTRACRIGAMVQTVIFLFKDDFCHIINRLSFTCSKTFCSQVLEY